MRKKATRISWDCFGCKESDGKGNSVKEKQPYSISSTTLNCMKVFLIRKNLELILPSAKQEKPIISESLYKSHYRFSLVWSSQGILRYTHINQTILKKKNKFLFLNFKLPSRSLAWVTLTRPIHLPSNFRFRPGFKPIYLQSGPGPTLGKVKTDLVLADIVWHLSLNH